MSGLALVVSVVAFALLGLSTDTHALARFGARPDAATRRFRRYVAWALLAIAFALAVWGHGWIFGPIQWSGIVMLAAGLVFLALNLLPPSLRMKS